MLVLVVLAFLPVSAFGADTDIVAYAGSVGADGPFGSGLPADYCFVDEVIGKTAAEIGPKAIALHNAVTMGACWGVCRNPATFLSTDEVALTFSLVSTCTGDTYVAPIRPIRNPKQNYCMGPNVGNPCNVAAQAKIQVETDYSSPAQGGLSFVRFYNSRVQLDFRPNRPSIGRGWRTNFDCSGPRFNGTVPAKDVRAIPNGVDFARPSGQVLTFSWDTIGSYWVAAPDVRERLEQVVDGSSNHLGWILRNAEGAGFELYGVDGKLTQIVDAYGFGLALTYAADGTLAKVNDAWGRSLSFGYDTSSRISSVTRPDGSVTKYEYDGSGYLNRVVMPDQTPASSTDNPIRTYHYEWTGPTGLKLLTGITDELSNRFTTWNYDSAGRPVLSVRGSSVSTIDRVKIVYNLDTSVTVTEATGQQRTYTWVDQLGVRKLGSMSTGCVGCGGSIEHSRTYDSNGYVDVVTDFRGTSTDYNHDARGLETQRIEAKGTTAQRTIQTDWHASFRVPTERRTYDMRATLVAKTQWAINSRGQVTATCVIDPSDSTALAYACSTAPPTGAKVRRSTTSYCEAADVAAPNSTCPLLGLIKATNGPRPAGDTGMVGKDDTTTYIYYPSTDETGCATLGGACHRKGDPWKATNALGQVSENVSYDRAGRLTRLADPNGTLTDFAYDAVGRLLTRSVRAKVDGSPSSEDATTTFAYDAAGNVSKITQPDGAYLAYTYDVAHRLTEIVDNGNNKIRYTLDAAGNRIKEETLDTTGALARSLARQYNTLNRLTQALNASGQAILKHTLTDPAAGIIDGYDSNGNLIQSLDGLNVETKQSVDPLNRLIKTIQDTTGTDPTTHNATTEYSYDTRDNLRTIRDPSLLLTTYTYDALNNLTALDSPDTGHTGYIYDRADNRISQTDNRGVTSTYDYDAINRLTAISYVDKAQNVRFAYDEADAVTGCTGSFPFGRLTRMTDQSGSTTYCYDRRGNVLKKVQISNSIALTTAYTYTKADRLASLIYPSGATLSYGRDSVGRINLVTWQANAKSARVSVVSNATYYPFGPLSVLTYGNSRTLSKTYDQDYVIDRVVSSGPNGLTLDFTTDSMGNIIDASSTVGATPKTLKYVYDHLYRLSEVDSGRDKLVEDYDYNLTGDRTRKQLGIQPPQVSTYLAGMHRLGAIDGAARDYDKNGNTLDRGDGVSLKYDERNRLSSVGHMSYVYNGRGERVIKTSAISPILGGTETLTVYDERGQMAEYLTYNIDGKGNRTLTGTTDLLYLDNLPIAQVTDGLLSYLETDHLGTPRLAINPTTNAQQWKWDFFASAFGDNPATPAASGGIDVKLRYPGQVFDGETGLHYNYFRDYEPSTGRYVESDPDGLQGGLSTFSYVGNSPLQNFDPFGLLNVTASEVWNGSELEWLYSIDFSNCRNAILLKITDQFAKGPVKWLKNGIGRMQPKPAGDADILDLVRRCKCMNYDPALKSFFEANFGEPGQLMNEASATAALDGLRGQLGRIRRKECNECANDHFYNWDRLLEKARARGTKSWHAAGE